jgi:hypothetical protein
VSSGYEVAHADGRPLTGRELVGEGLRIARDMGMLTAEPSPAIWSPGRVTDPDPTLVALSKALVVTTLLSPLSAAAEPPDEDAA